jgi:hypothetical protein
MSLPLGRGERRVRSCGLMRKRRCEERLELVGGLDDGSSDDDGMGDPRLLLRQLQAFPTATINGISSAKRRGVRTSSWENVPSLIA